MKLIYLILFLSVIVCNEIVVELIFTDDHKVSLIDGSAEEKAESENFELEGEGEVDFFNDILVSQSSANSLMDSSISNDVANVMNPFIEIHSPPPDFS